MQLELVDRIHSLSVLGLRYNQMLTIRRFFFFKQKTAYEMRISDWSPDVCSSDLCRTMSDDCGFTGRSAAPYHDRRKAGGSGTIDRCAGGEIGRASCRERVCQYV